MLCNVIKHNYVFIISLTVKGRWCGSVKCVAAHTPRPCYFNSIWCQWKCLYSISHIKPRQHTGGLAVIYCLQCVDDRLSDSSHSGWDEGEHGEGERRWFHVTDVDENHFLFYGCTLLSQVTSAAECERAVLMWGGGLLAGCGGDARGIMQILAVKGKWFKWRVCYKWLWIDMYSWINCHFTFY